MMEPSINCPILGSAYRVYLEETSKHLKEAALAFAREDALSPEDLYVLGARFHTIRGGAGFFGLSEIAAAARQLEELLGQPGLDLRAERPTVDRLFEELSDLVSRLPPAPAA